MCPDIRVATQLLVIGTRVAAWHKSFQIIGLSDVSLRKKALPMVTALLAGGGVTDSMEATGNNLSYSASLSS